MSRSTTQWVGAKRWLVVAILATVLTSIAAALPADAAVASAGAVVADAGSMARTDGEWVVWMAGGSNVFDPAARLWARRVDGGEPFMVTTTTNARGWPAVDGGIVVWIENRPERECPVCRASLVGKDLASGREFVVASDVVLAANYQPAISDGVVVWASGSTIWARDIDTMNPREAIATVAAGDCYHRYGPVISGDRVVWMECYEPAIPDPRAYPNYRILTVRLGEDAATVVVDEPGNPIGYDLDGDRLVYASPTTGITVVDPASGARQVVGSGRNPTIAGRLVVWEDPADPWDESNPQVDLVAFDLATSTTFAAVEGQRVNLRPDAAGGVAVWQQTDRDVFGAEEPTELRIARVNDLLPGAPRPQPAGDPNVTFFTETGHALRLGFRFFWEGNGGLPVFGFPLTEEVLEPNVDMGAVYLTQFTERQRFEYHPENAGTTYEVLLGRLGAELLVAQGRDWRDFSTADPAAEHYQAATGHAVDARFSSYWASHGLDLGDPGVSFRESLALFGYPLSEGMVETNGDGDTVLTQYFERAVFEYHADNPPEWRVLLRRLGAEEVARRGW